MISWGPVNDGLSLSESERTDFLKLGRILDNREKCDWHSREEGEYQLTADGLFEVRECRLRTVSQKNISRRKAKEPGVRCWSA